MKSFEIEFAPPEPKKPRPAADVRDALAFLVRVAALLLLVTAIPLNVWLWTVAL